MEKSEIFHVFHLVTDDKAIIETTQNPSKLMFWDKYKHGCVVVSGKKVVAYGDFRCATGDRDKRELVILATKTFLENNMEWSI